MANNKNRHHRVPLPVREIQGDKEVLSRPIESLNLPEETLTLLKNNRFITIYDVAKRTEREMFRVQTFNKKHLVSVKSAINAVGIDFAPYIPPDNNAQAGEQSAEKSAANKPTQNRQQQDNGQKNRPQNEANGTRECDRQLNSNNNRQNKNQQNINSKPQNKNQQKIYSKPQNGNGKQQNKQQPNFRSSEQKRSKVELPLEEWQKISKNGKWGFSNGITTVIQPQFDEVFCFKDGLACVDVGDKFGYIDHKGEFVITPQYECAMSFSEGMAVFFKGEKCGYINKLGEVVIPAKYDAATIFENGRAKVKEAGKWQTIDPEGNTLWSK